MGSLLDPALEAPIIAHVRDELASYKRDEGRVSSYQELADAFSTDNVTVTLHQVDALCHRQLSIGERQYRETAIHTQSGRETHAKIQRGPTIIEMRRQLADEIDSKGGEHGVSLTKIVEQSKNARLWLRCYDAATFRHDSFAFLLGLCQRSFRRLSTDIRFAYSEYSFGRLLHTMIDTVFGEIAGEVAKPNRREPGRKIIRFYSEQVLYVVTAITKNFRDLPMMLLTSNERRLQYLRGFLWNGCAVEECRGFPRVEFRRRAGCTLDLVRKVQGLLTEFAIDAVDRWDGFVVRSAEGVNLLLNNDLLPPGPTLALEEMLKPEVVDPDQDLRKRVELAKAGVLVDHI